MSLHDVVLELREIRADIQALKQEMHRYKGFVGGVLWCVSAVASVIGFVWGLVMKA